MEQYIYKSALELAALIREGKATSVAIVSEHLSRIKKHNGRLNALISVFETEALAEAAACDREAGEGRFRGPLHGVPVTIKESFWIKGRCSTTNFKMLRDFIAPGNAVVVDRILQSGAIILGQTNVPKNLIDYQVLGDLYPEGVNPYNPEFTPGGSTGGGAAALAAGFTPLELGSDFGGSVRVPSSFCCLYGLKPTDKTVPLHGLIPLPKNAKTFLVHMAQAGPLARTPEDLETLWNIIVGPHESDRGIPDIHWKQPLKSAPGDYRIAWTDRWPDYESGTQVREAITRLVTTLGSKGYILEKKIPDETLHRDTLINYVSLFPYVIAQGTPAIIRALIKLQLYTGLLKGMKKDAPHLTRPMNKAFRMRANHYGEVMLQRSFITRRWEQFFDHHDFLICPIAFGPAFKRCKTGARLPADGKTLTYCNYTWPYVACFNASGHPSVAVPLGLTPEGLPIGIQVVGRYWSEPELLNFVKKIAPLTEGFITPAGFDLL